MDAILSSADSQLHVPTDERRQAISASFIYLGAPQGSRLMYRPEPSYSILPSIVEEPFLSHDGSFQCLVHDLLRCQPTVIDESLEDAIDRFEPRPDHATFLTHLDAYACVPRNRHTPALTDRVRLIRRLAAEFEEFVESHGASAAVEFDERDMTVWKLSLLTYLSRLYFYCARMDGWTMERLHSTIQDCATKLDLPMSEGRSLLAEVAESFEAEYEELSEQHADDVELEWVDTPVEVSTIASQPEDLASADDCVICFSAPDADSVLTRACRHPFCAECLQTWIHACQGNSHRCPICRTELFERPQYQPRETPSGVEDRIAYLERAIEQAEALSRSMEWLCEELELHVRVTGDDSE